MNKTQIDWADYTWNPITGCLHGCDYCYAAKTAHRFGKKIEDEHADGKLHILNGKIKDNPYPYLFEPTLHTYRLREPQEHTVPKTIFVGSMADVFGKWVSLAWINAVFDACAAAPQHRYLFLTKNPQRLCDLANRGFLPINQNYWYGTTITKAGAQFFGGRIRDNVFLSIEPLLEPLDTGIGSFGGARWIIIGAETGNRPEKVTPKREWVENIVETARLTGASVFMKRNLVECGCIKQSELIQEYPWEDAE